MSANLMVRPSSCPARDTLCSGGQMLSISQMGQSRRLDRTTATSGLPPINGHRQRSAARIIGAERPASRRYRSVR